MFPSAIIRNVDITLDPSLTLDVYVNKLSKAAFLQLCRSQTLLLCQPKRCRIISVCFYYIAHWLVMLFLLAYQHSQFLAYNTFKILLQVYYLTLNDLLIITPVLFDLHWLPVSFCIIYKIVLLIFKSRNGLAPSYLSDRIAPYVPSRSLQSSGCHFLTVPRFCPSSMGVRSFPVISIHSLNLNHNL